MPIIRGMGTHTRSRSRLAAPGLLLLLSACAAPDAPPARRFGGETELWRRMLAAEDGRTPSPAALGAFEDGLRSADPELRRWAVRAIGRMERENLLPMVLPVLSDLSATVRAEAANAAGQAISRADPAPARAALVERLSQETDPAVRGVIGETLGRLRHASAEDVRRTADLLTALSGPEPEEWLGVAKGLHFLVRQPVARGALPESVTDRLRALTTYEIAATGAAATLAAARIRRVSTAALAATARMTAADISTLLQDPDDLVRREAAAAIARLADRAAARPLAARALEDASPRVRFEGARAAGAVLDAGAACDALAEAARDADGHVALQAIDAMAGVCAGNAPALAELDSLVAALPGNAESDDWHRAVHALVSLARLDAGRARTRLPAFAEHENGFVRTYAARAAVPLEDGALLRRLAEDAWPNVRTAAVEGLRTVAGHDADDVYIRQLAEDDSQLLQVSAAALEGSAAPAALPALLNALDRVSTWRRETWRDSRRALLLRIGELGDSASADRIRPRVSDYDVEIAGLAADVIGEWTGQRPEPRPRPLPRLELPSLEQVEPLDSSVVILEMADGGRIGLRLFPFEAPANAWRFVRLAREGYYDGLTFHRVAPNFVIQGGSPAANEYAGDGPFTRDELGLVGNWRGTVGLSTRGRDTGDAQIYVNLIDNTRLDHDYTVFGEIVSGLDVVDRIMEGAVIRRVRVAPR